MWKIRFSDFAYNLHEYMDSDIRLVSYQDEFVIKNNNFSWNTFLDTLQRPV